MSEKPEALRLADDLETVIRQEDAEDNVILVPRWTAEESADALRRQHAEIERLKAVALQAQNAAIDLAYRYQRMREALERIADAFMSMHQNAAHMAVNLQGIAQAALRRDASTAPSTAAVDAAMEPATEPAIRARGQEDKT